MEWALMDGGRSFSTVFLDPDAALMGGGKTPVVKLHGAIDHPHTMVFTSGDFDAFSGLMENRIFGATAFEALLVVGYRGSDPNFRRILKLVKEHYGGAMPLLIDFGREAERRELLDAGLFLVDPGAGEYDRLADIVAWLGDLDVDAALTAPSTFVRGTSPGLGSTDVILAHVRDAALALIRIEPDRATVFKLFDLLTERHRRAILRRDRLPHEFADIGRVNLLLHELANRRLVHFEERLEGHELVHDSLVEPIREFLEQHRVDFSHDDLMGLARRVFAGETLSPGAVTNLALFCLRRGVSPAWLEESTTPVGGGGGCGRRLESCEY
jgi:hypothetical protein